MTTRFIPGDNPVVETTQFVIGTTGAQLQRLIDQVTAVASAGYASHAAAREITAHVTTVQTDLSKLGALLPRQAGWKE